MYIESVEDANQLLKNLARNIAKSAKIMHPCNKNLVCSFNNTLAPKASLTHYDLIKDDPLLVGSLTMQIGVR